MFSLLSLTFALTFLAPHLIEGKQISCERIENYDWFRRFPNGKICYLENTLIDSNKFTISPRRNEPMALKLELNKKAFYLPINLQNTFPQLKLYYASDCSIKALHKDNFKNLKKLIMLNLSFNQIQRIDSDTFDDLTSLEFLSLRELNNFNFCSVLTFCILGDNPIKFMSGKVFKNLKKLTTIQLINTSCEKGFSKEDISSEDLIKLSAIVESNCGASSCGKTLMLSGLVKGGSQAKRGQWPFLAALENREGRKFFCGGNLISSRHVLTGELKCCLISNHEIINEFIDL